MHISTPTYVNTGTPIPDRYSASAPEGYDLEKLSYGTFCHLRIIFSESEPRNESFVDQDQWSEYTHLESIDKRIDYYDHHFVKELNSYWNTNLALTLILALALALYTYGIIKWSSDLDPQYKLIPLAVPGGCGIVTLNAFVVYRLITAARARNLSEEYKEYKADYKARLEAKNQWHREYNAYIVGRNKELLETAREKAYQRELLAKPYREEIANEIEKIIKAVREYTPAKPKGECPSLPDWFKIVAQDHVI